MDDDLADGFPPKQHATLLRRVRLILLVLVVLAGIAVLALSVEPARAAVWHAVGQQCGDLTFPSAPLVRDFTAAEDCFAIAYYRCQATSLTVRQPEIDTILTQTFVVEPSLAFVRPCGLADVWSNSVDAGRIRRSGTESCRGLTQQPDGLLFQGCGQLGDIFVPSAL